MSINDRVRELCEKFGYGMIDAKKIAMRESVVFDIKRASTFEELKAATLRIVEDLK